MSNASFYILHIYVCYFCFISLSQALPNNVISSAPLDVFEILIVTRVHIAYKYSLFSYETPCVSNQRGSQVRYATHARAGP